MRKLIWLMLLVSSVCLAEEKNATPIIAADSTDKEFQELKLQGNEAVKNIPNLIEQYANTLGCEFNMNPQNVVEYTIDSKKRFVALFSLDVGCSGGSSMSRPVFVALTSELSYPKIFIDAKYSAPNQTSDDFPQTITSIFLKDNKLWYSALDFDFKKDALCCPSVPITGELKFENEKWKGIPNKTESPKNSSDLAK